MRTGKQDLELGGINYVQEPVFSFNISSLYFIIINTVVIITNTINI